MLIDNRGVMSDVSMFKIMIAGIYSGTCHEQRVIDAYVSKMLVPLRGKDACLNVKMCIECGDQGHFGRDCEKMFETID